MRAIRGGGELGGAASSAARRPSAKATSVSSEQQPDILQPAIVRG